MPFIGWHFDAGANGEVEGERGVGGSSLKYVTV